MNIRDQCESAEWDPSNFVLICIHVGNREREYYFQKQQFLPSYMLFLKSDIDTSSLRGGSMFPSFELGVLISMK